jgi:glucans biosynthesis protein C
LNKSTSTQAPRQDYIDWLRAGAMFLLLFYHTGRLFDEPGWHIKNTVLNEPINIFNRFLDIWHMPLFFILAGASVWFAMGKRSAGTFALERVLRLLVPLVFGMLIIVPPQVYYERIFDGDFSGSFAIWYPNTFHGFYSSDSASGNLSWHHLWFLAYLFVFSLLLIPLFRYFRSEKRTPLITRFAGFFEKPGAIFLPALLLIIYNVTLRPIYGYGNQNLIDDWANFLFYITVFFYGFLLMANGRFLQTIRRNRYITLIVAILLSLGIAFLDNDIIPGSEDVKEGLILVFQAVACWSWLMTIISAGSLLLTSNNKLLRYATEAVLPVYILHQTLIVVIGFYVVQWNTSVAPKYFFIVFATLAGSLAVYELVRRLNVTRFLFGIKTRKRPAVPQS